MPPTIPADAAEKALAAAELAGLSRRAVFAAAGIDPAATALGFDELCAIYEEAARLTGDPAFGLHVGEQTSARMYGRLGYVVANSGSFGEAMDRIAEFQRIWTDAVEFDVRRSRGGLVLRYRHAGAVPAERRRQEHEQMISGLLAFARSALGEKVVARRVRFEHAAPADLSEHRRIFGGPVSFAAPVTEIEFAAQLLGRPIVGADTVLGELIREQATPVLAERLRREPMLDRLQHGLEAAIHERREVTLSAQAATLRMGPRTLQRRLRQSGLTFSRAVDEARVGVARTLLAEPELALAEIAFRLGFSQTSAFHRAFRRLAGCTPGEYRRSLFAAEQRR